MKTKLLPILGLLCLALAACNEDELDPGQERVETRPCDERAWFLANFVRTDAQGNTLARPYGRVLDEGDPAVVYVAADNFAQADTLLRKHWLPESAAQRVESKDGTLVCRLQDQNGQSQGTVTLQATDESVLYGIPAVAHLSLSDGAASAQLREVWLIETSAWPENDVIDHRKGEVLRFPAYDIQNGIPTCDSLPFVCIADAKAGQPSYFVRVSEGNFLSGALTAELLQSLASAADARSAMQLALADSTAQDLFGEEHFLIQSNTDGFQAVWCHRYAATSIPVYYIGYTEYIQTFDWYVDQETLTAADVSHRTLSVVCL